MISINTSLSELQRCYTALDSAVGCYRDLVSDLAAHCVVAADDETQSMRSDLRRLVAAVGAAPVRELPEYGPQVREWLAAYGERVSSYIAELEERQTATARAFEELVASLSQADDDHDGRIKITIEKLRAIARTPEARPLRNVLCNAAESVEKSVEQIRKEHQLTISQFHNEIRTLQQRLDPEGNETGGDPLTLVLTRVEMQEKIRSSRSGGFSVIMLHVRGLGLAAAQYGAQVAAQVALAVNVRLRNLLPVSSAISRWGDEEFVCVIPAGSCGGSTHVFCATLADQLAGTYGCSRNGKIVRPSVEITVCSVEAGTKDAPEHILEQVETALLRI